MGDAKTAVRPMPDAWLAAAALAILALGVAMVYSASSALAFHEFGDSFYYVKRQAIFAALGVLAMQAAMRVEYRAWHRYAHVLLAVCFALLVVVLIPGIGDVRGGARSWLGIGSFGIQPSEFMKFGLIVFLARHLSERGRELRRFFRGLLPPLALIAAAFGLIMLQPDFGTGAVLVAASLMMVFAAGARFAHLAALAGVGLAGLAALIAAAPYRLRRIVAFLDPWSDPLGAGYQAIQSLYAIGPGGLFGLGYGNSLQKHSYLPEPQTDFIFSILAEELGFLGGAALIALFLVFVWRGMRAAMMAPDAFGGLLATGLVGMVAVQVIINIGVVIGLLPVTGITLPLVSYGGSSLTLVLTAIGVLLNISRHAR
ncbi:MAG: stage V sporulation protein E [Candidatus Reconcilbacillus cellulovorans]|uniref:Stage V sporulation protein E n=1 Tax=Candidatus Reconcilbacillus cellulovorans TaxID=1906605 RepID=A0A2A6E2L1_9BACL|nr:MAG: stage V sporulation protein E [Candidatus Reconcilbacillus cellulovorans]